MLKLVTCRISDLIDILKIWGWGGKVVRHILKSYKIYEKSIHGGGGRGMFLTLLDSERPAELLNKRFCIQPGAGCSKLPMSLFNVSLKFKT